MEAGRKRQPSRAPDNTDKEAATTEEMTKRKTSAEVGRRDFNIFVGHCV